MADDFDAKAFIDKQNQDEAAKRAGKIPEKPEPVKAASDPVSEDGEEQEEERHETPRLPRSTVRELNRLRELAAEERGRRIAVEEMMAKGLTKPEAVAKVDENADPEPQRKDFTSDADYNRALGRWDSRQETKKELSKASEQSKNEKDLEKLRTQVSEMDKKAEEDKKLIPDYDEVAAAALEDDEQPQFNPSEHLYLMRRLATSDVKAYLLHHLAKNPKDMKRLLDLTPDLESQASMISRLEGRVERMYSEKPKDEKKELTAAERDAKKHKPTEAAAPRGGSAAPARTPMLLEDGKTLNPAWKSEQNERQGLRR